MNYTNIISEKIITELQAGKSTNQVLLKTKEILDKYKLQVLYPSILKKVKLALLAKKKQETFVIESAFALDETLVPGILRSVGLKDNTPVTVSQKAELLAGWRAMHEGYVYDASALRHIQKLRKINKK